MITKEQSNPEVFIILKPDENRLTIEDIYYYLDQILFFTYVENTYTYV